MTSKLQITLPKRLAEEHGIAPGDEVRFESAAGAIRMIPASAGAGALGLEERLRLFDEATRRAAKHADGFSHTNASGKDRGWTRESLYERGSTD